MIVRPMMLAVATLSGGLLRAEAPPAALQDQLPNLVIYRSHVAPILFKATIGIDGRTVAALSNGQYAATRLDAGPHRITLRWPMLSAETGGGADIDIKDGETLYLAVAAKGHGSLMRNPPTIIEPVDPARAQAAIARCCHDHAAPGG